MYVSDLISISVATLSPTAAIGTDLYCQSEDPSRAVLYRGSNYPMKPGDLEKLRQRGVTKLYIAPEGRGEYQSYLRSVASGCGDASTSQRGAALNEVVLSVLQNNFARRDNDATVAASENLGSMAADLVTRDDFAVADLLRVLHHDYATFTHSANVAYYAGILADGLGFSRADVGQIIAGGLLHDLGKLDIDDKILTKPGRLDDAEFDQIKKHPTVGFKQLAHRRDLSWGQLMMVYQHHERLNGDGYPVGCVGDEIHPWAKLCAVVDVYEAVTSQRPYRKPMPREQACELLQRESKQVLEPEMVECWVSIIRNTMPT